MYDWDHCKVVLAIARTGSMTLAARQLGMDQTTVGRQLSALEKQLNAELFIRSKSGFLATESGQIVIASARRVEAELAAMDDSIAQNRESIGGMVRLAANTWMLNMLAGEAMAPLMAQHPDLELRLSGRLPPAPLYSEPSVSLWFDAAPHAPERSVPLCTVPYATYEGASLKPSVGDWLQFRDDMVTGPSFARQLTKRLPKDARVRLTATDAGILASGVRAGLGKAALPICLAEKDERLLRAKGEKIDRVLHLHIGDDVADLPRVRLVVDWLANSVEDLFQGRSLLKPGAIGKRKRT